MESDWERVQRKRELKQLATFPISLCLRRLGSLEMAIDTMRPDELDEFARRLTELDDWAWGNDRHPRPAPKNPNLDGGRNWGPDL